MIHALGFDSLSSLLLVFAVHALLQTTVIVLITPALVRIVAPRRPATRHGILFAALLLVLVGPGAATLADGLGASLIQMPLWTEAPATGEAEVPILDGGVLESEPATAAAATPASATPGGTASVPWWTLLAGTWLLGSLFLLGRLAHGLWLARRLRRGAQPLGDAAVLAHLKATFGHDMNARVLVSERVDRPLALGVLDPVVLLPARVVTRLRAEQLADVVVHECAHLVRHDVWVGLLQRVATVLYWPQPLLVPLNRALARAREEVCDDHVLRSGSGTRYARTLLAVSDSLDPSTSSGVALGLLAPRWSLEARIDGLLSKERVPMIRAGLSTLLPVTLLLVGLTVVLVGVQLAPAEAADPVARTPQNSEKVSEEDAAVLQALRANGDLEFDRQSFDEVVSFLSVILGVELVFDVEAERRKALSAQRITLTLSNVHVGNILALVLRHVDLTYRIREGKVVILEHVAAAKLPAHAVLDPATIRKARRALDKVEVTLSLEDAPLGDILKLVQHSANVNIMLDTLALKQAGKDRSTKVGVKAEGPVLKVLEKLLEPAGLAAIYKHEAIIVTTREQAEKEKPRRRR